MPHFLLREHTLKLALVIQFSNPFTKLYLVYRICVKAVHFR
uniref:Uncharacterized protein n=1 Tax=Anguilla anguilla TaxID=7936 RepID=A0A0E9V113_ANGAN